MKRSEARCLLAPRTDEISISKKVLVNSVQLYFWPFSSMLRHGSEPNLHKI